MSTRLAVFTVSLVFALAGCAVAGAGDDTSSQPPAADRDAAAHPASDSGAPPTADDGGTTDPSDGACVSDGNPEAGGGTGLGCPMDMFAHVNSDRVRYQPPNHIPYDGYPFEGQNASAMTWDTQMTWDDTLASVAQTKAKALAAGGQPDGMGFPYQNHPGEPMWLTGLDTAQYQLSAKSSPSTKTISGGGWTDDDPCKWHLTNNGMYRMAVAYQTGSGTYNHRTKLGVGMAEVKDGSGDVWWVLIFGE